MHIRQTAAERARRAEAIAAVAVAVNHESTLDAVLRVAIQQGVGAMGADAGSISLLGSDGEMLTSVAEVHARAARTGVVVRLPQFPHLAAAAQQGRPVFVAYRQAHDPERRWLEALGSAGSICVPLLARGQFIGMYFLNYRDPAYRPVPEDLEFAAAVGAHCASAIDKALLLAQAEAERNRLRQMLEQMLEGVLIIDAQTGRILVVNPAAARLLGGVARLGEPMEHVPLRVLDATTEHAVPREQWPDQRALAGEIVPASKLLLELPDGARCVVLASAVPLCSATGQVRETLLVFQDISELYRLDRERDHLLALISHELRNPLASVLGYAQVLLRQLGADAARERRAVSTIEAQAHRMNHLIEHLQNASRLHTGALTLAPCVVDLAALARRVAEQLQVTTDAHTIHLDVEEPLPCECDPARIEQVLSNLLSNAIKYSPASGDIWLTVRRTGSQVRLSVCDRGVGIPRQAQPRLFERFYRAPNISNRTSGLGLGLYICGEVVRRHGGRIWVESAADQGATFYVELPASLPAPPAAPAPQEA
jgi:signal transduction histidine kinase